MTTTHDPISDLLSRIRNASMVGKKSVSIPHSTLKESLVGLLIKEKYLENMETKGKKDKKVITFEIVYDETERPKIKGLELVSKLSRRIYSGYKNIMPVKYGHGHLVISTPKGVMTDEVARKEKVGGEVLFKVW